MSDGGYIEGGPVPVWPKLRDEYIISFKEVQRHGQRALEVLRIAAAGAQAENEELRRATEAPGTATASVNDAPDA